MVENVFVGRSCGGMLLGMGVGETGWLEGQPVGKAARRLWNRGFTFDYISDRQLLGDQRKEVRGCQRSMGVG